MGRRSQFRYDKDAALAPKENTLDSAYHVKPEETEILIAEDSPTQAERLRLLLEAQSYRTRVAHNGIEALQAIRERRPHLVLSDIVMPEMDGYELCRAIKSDPDLADISVILVTSLTDPKDIVRGIECGADNFVRKPFAEDYLLNRITQMLMNQLLRRESNVEFGIGLYLGNQKHFINAERQQILDLLISTYEQAVQVNAELQQRERQVTELNTRLASHSAELEATNREVARKNLELAQANSMKSAFIANMSHELRTPLNAILGFTGALLMKLPGPLTGEQEKQLGTIRSSARHLLSLINDILDVARIEAGKVSLSPEPVDCRELVQECADTLRQLAAGKGLALRLEMSSDPMVVRTDRRALTQVILNLLNNAIKFTDQGSVSVALSRRTERQGAITEIAVSDTGAGIREQDQARLFDAFSQVDGTTTRNAEGAGLGLYLSRNLARLLGGDVTCTSQYGAGSTFRLVLRDLA